MLKQIGGTLALFGILSIALSFIGYNLRILIWIDALGPAIAWGIRIGLVVIGAVLFFVGSQQKQAAS